MTITIPTIYVAGSSAEMPRATSAMHVARRIGFHVTHDWVGEIERVGTRQGENLSSEARVQIARNGIRAVKDARVFWLLAPTKPTVGAWVEYGIAVGAENYDGKIVLISGEKEGEVPSIFTSVAHACVPKDEHAEAILTDLYESWMMT